MHAVLLALAVGMTDDPEPAAVKFDAKLKKDKDDKFEAKDVKGAVVWEITSKSGIGAATVELKSGKMPKKITLRFVGMRSLEKFGLSAGGVALAPPAWRDKERTVYYDAKGKPIKEAKGSAGSMKVEKKGDDVEVTLENPVETKTWVLTWVDAYRR